MSIDLSAVPDDGIISDINSILPNTGIVDQILNNESLGRLSSPEFGGVSGPNPNFTGGVEQTVDNGASIPGGASTPSQIFQPPQKQNVQYPSSEWNGFRSLSYAYGLANTQFRPKTKFMFYVDFAFKPELISAAQQDWAKNFMFMAYAMDRPGISFEFEEVNQYNFRTKVLKSSKYKDVTITFYDDGDNNVMDFFRFVMTLLHPVARRSNTADGSLQSGIFSMNDGHGMVFSNDTFAQNDYSHRGVVNSDDGNIFQTIKLTQTVMVPGVPVEEAARESSFLFINPKIIDFQLSDVSHENSDVCNIVMTFSYDTVLTTAATAMREPRNPMEMSDAGLSDITTIGGVANYSSPQSQLILEPQNKDAGFEISNSIGQYKPASRMVAGGFNTPGKNPFYGTPGFTRNSTNQQSNNDNPLGTILRNPVVSQTMSAAMRVLPPQVRQIVNIINGAGKSNDPSKILVKAVNDAAVNKALQQNISTSTDFQICIQPKQTIFITAITMQL